MAFGIACSAYTLRYPIEKLEKNSSIATIKSDDLQVGMSGYVVHHLGGENSIIVASSEVVEVDKDLKETTIKLSNFEILSSDSLPTFEQVAKVGDEAVFAYGYDKALLIAPNEEIHYRISNSTRVEWVHPDIFATLLSKNAHATPTRDDFSELSHKALAGVVFIYLEGRVFTLDALSFKILAISDAPLEQSQTQLPFYSRLESINSSWFGEGSGRLSEYEPHYYKMIIDANYKNIKLFDIVKVSQNINVKKLVNDFDFKGERDASKRRFIFF